LSTPASTLPLIVPAMRRSPVATRTSPSIAAGSPMETDPAEASSEPSTVPRTVTLPAVA